MDLVALSAREAERLLAPVGTRWAHSQAVADQGRILAPALPEGDREVLIAAAYLHDVGYAPELAVTAFHPVDGARWLRDQGYERLACLVANHTGARWEAESRDIAELLVDFPEERSATADALTYADLTTDAEGRLVTPGVRLAEIEQRYGAESAVASGLRGPRVR
jgi:HD superfamily phosphodiesterase